MIYCFETGQYERKETFLFEGPAGLNLGMDAFLESLGLRPVPNWPSDQIAAAPPDLQCVLVEGYNTDRRAWDDERVALLKANAIYKQEQEAHLAWVRMHPELREIEFETI